MSDEEDDYLSDKFLVDPTPSSSTRPKTYAERRQDALRRAALKNEQNRLPTRAERERAAREEGLGTSLFERAREEEVRRGDGARNKALTMMMKMGFRPGQALGREEGDGQANDRPREEGGESPSASAEVEGGREDEDGRRSSRSEEPAAREEEEPVRAGLGARPPRNAPVEAAAKAGPSHRTVPLAINEWEGKKGIGLRKRAASPSGPERLAKMARMADERAHASFRDRAREEYDARRAAGRLHPAQRTCATLDERAGVQFNVLWLDPENPESFPEGLLDALDDPAVVVAIERQRGDHSIEGRLKAKMQADALRPLESSLDDTDDTTDAAADKTALRSSPYSEEELQEVTQFLRLGPTDRLTLVLDYLRRKYAYCFWCGTQYEDDGDLAANCPGPDEDAHD